MDNDIEVTGLSLGRVLAALYNNTRAQGMGALHSLGRPMTVEEGDKIVDTAKKNQGVSSDRNTWRVSFDYVLGRPIKVRFVTDEVGRTWIGRSALYDRDSGSTVFEVVEQLKAGAL